MNINLEAAEVIGHNGSVSTNEKDAKYILRYNGARYAFLFLQII